MKCPRCGQDTAVVEPGTLGVYDCEPCKFRWQTSSRGGVDFYTYGRRTGPAGADVFRVPMGTLPVFLEDSE